MAMSTKTVKKKQQKIIEDRTFGLKNKNKSKAVQKYVKGVEQTVKFNGESVNKLQSDAFQRQKAKKKEQEEQALLNALYGQAEKIKKAGEIEQEDDDPKNQVCPYFKQGLCNRGKKCIYSHDLTLDRTQQIDLYVDQRTQLIMNDLGERQLGVVSEEDLAKMINEKQAKYKGSKSQIVCKHFLDAVQKGKYGWNWSCPNGDEKCQYKHCLPPGYKLRKDAPKVAQEQIDIETKIDEERNKLLAQNISSPLVTFEIFLKWKAEKIERKKVEAQEKRKQLQKKKGNKNIRTGRQLFEYDPTLFVDDEQAAADYEEREQIQQQDEEQQKKEDLRGSEEEQQQEKEQNLQVRQEKNQDENQTQGQQ